VLHIIVPVFNLGR